MQFSVQAVFRRMRVTTRIAILGVVATVSVLALAGTYLVGERFADHALSNADRFQDLNDEVTQAEAGALQMRRREKDFLLRRDPKYVEAYRAAYASTLNALDAMAANPASAAVADEVARLRENLPRHAAQFDKVAALVERMGYDEEAGLNGALRAAVHAVETKLKEANLDALTVKMLMMRRHEKDFMLRGHPKYIGRIDERRAEFDALLEPLVLTADFKAEVSAFMDTYQSGVHEWSDAYLILAEDTTQLSALFAEMEPDFDAIHVSAATSLAEARASLHGLKAMTQTITIAASLLLVTMAVLLAYLIGTSISRPLRALCDAVSGLAAGDIDVAIDASDARNEFGELSRALLVFRDTEIKRRKMAATEAEREMMDADRKKMDEERERMEAERKSMEAEQAKQREAEEARLRAEAEQAETIRQLTSEFETTASEVLNAVTDSSQQLKAAASSMTEAADRTGERSSEVANASEDATTNVETVAAAAEEMSASIREIAERVTQSSAIANRAVARASAASGKVEELVATSQKVGEIVSLIEDIASQTNLLALNATIEASRAGEAGKGFAVVASEVKALANQTGNATGEIARQIEAIQSSSEDAAEAISEIAGTIDEINVASSAVSSAVEEQDATTREISANVQRAATGVRGVSDNIVAVSRDATDTGAAACQVMTASQELEAHSKNLNHALRAYLDQVTAA